MADRVVTVTAHVGRDPAEGGSRPHPLEVMSQAGARAEQVGDVLGVALAGAAQRLKPREREVLGQVLVGGGGGARVGLSLAAGRTGIGVGSAAVAGPRRVLGRGTVGVVEVLGVALPAHPGGVELVKQRLDAGRVDAAVGPGGRVGALRGGHLPVVRVLAQRARQIDSAGEVVVVGAVHLRVGLCRLAADQRDVVVEAEVAGAEVVLEQDPLLRQRPPQIRVVVQAGERRVVGLVLEDDQPDVLDLARLDPEPVGPHHGAV